MLNRRAFLQLFSAGVAALTLDPERLLWVPGEKTIFLPALEQFSGDTFPAEFITKAIARMFQREV